MSIEKNIKIVEDFFVAMGRDDPQDLLALVAENIEWVIPGKSWALAGTHRGHAGVAAVHQAKQIRLGRQAWKDAEHVWELRVSVSRSIFALMNDRDRAYFGAVKAATGSA